MRYRVILHDDDVWIIRKALEYCAKAYKDEPTQSPRQARAADLAKRLPGRPDYVYGSAKDSEPHQGASRGQSSPR